MATKLILFCTALGFALSAFAAEEATPIAPMAYALAPSATTLHSGKTSTLATKTAARRVPAPTVSEMSVVRLADGSLVTGCIQVPNPKLKASAMKSSNLKQSTEPQP